LRVFIITAIKEELLFLIQDHCFGRVLERLEQRVKARRSFEKLRLFIDNHLSFFAANMAEMKVLSHEANRSRAICTNTFDQEGKYARLAERFCVRFRSRSPRRRALI